MNSITFSIGYLLAVLVMDVSSTDNFISNVHKTKFYSPYYFVFYKPSDKLLIMEITLQNIPPSVTAVTTTQFTSYDSSTRFYKPKPYLSTFEVNVDKDTRQGKFMILTSLKKHQIWVDVQLHKGTKVCHKTIITEGREITSNTEEYYWDTKKSELLHYKLYVSWTYSDDCLTPKTCEIIVDLTDTCKEQPISIYGDHFECHIEESQNICTFVRAATNSQDLVLYQTYEDSSQCQVVDSVGPVWPIGQQTTKFSIKFDLELFDKNTSVKLVSKWLREIKTIASVILSITPKDIKTASNVTILKYTETSDVQFSCEQYTYKFPNINVGFINTTDNKIMTHNTTIMKRNKFKMADNGTILCCIVYEYKKDGQEIASVTRFVKNKTLLIYQPHESTSTNLTESNKQRTVACQDKWWIYLLPTLLGVLVLLLTSIVIKQCWCANSKPTEDTVELDNYDSTRNQDVLYANLDHVHNESRARNQTEESPYANIIGVLHSL